MLAVFALIRWRLALAHASRRYHQASLEHVWSRQSLRDRDSLVPLAPGTWKPRARDPPVVSSPDCLSILGRFHAPSFAEPSGPTAG